MTADRSLFDVAPVIAHEVLIVEGSAYSVGPTNASRLADLGNPLHYPVTAVCSVCSGPVRRKSMAPEEIDWKHTGQSPLP